MATEAYFVVEARLPIQVSEASSVEEAARIAARRIEREYGVNIGNWYLRVFEYGGGEIKEHFSSPGGKFRQIDRNISTHEALAKENDGDQ